MLSQTAIPFMMIRGGSSKGIYFYDGDLPTDRQTRHAVLKHVMGAYGDPRQIDGLGGADPLTSKIGIVSLSDRDDCQINFEFIQALVGEDRLDETPNCGNLLAGAGAFALEIGLIKADGDEVEIAVFMVNSGKRCDLSFPVEAGLPVYAGDTVIDGVMGTSASVMCRYHDLQGSSTGSVLPTGNVCNDFDGVQVTCVDNGMPVVCLRAEDFGLVGQESPEELNANQVLKDRLESIRLQAGIAMGLGDVADKAIPKMCLVSPAQKGGAFSTRTFIPKQCHKAIGVLGAISVATAALYKDSVIQDLVKVPEGLVLAMRIEHPSGKFDVELELNPECPEIEVARAGLLRTARLISRGEVFIPRGIWEK